MISVTIDGNAVEVPEGTTVLNAAEMAGITIPTLCHHPELTPFGGCRLCVVEVEGVHTLQPSCTLPVSNGMVVYTNTPKVRQAREFVLTLLFSESNHFCMVCPVNEGDCELQTAAYGENMTEWPLQPNWQPYPVDMSQQYFLLDHNRCILCRRCIRACSELAGNFTLGMLERGANSKIIADLNVPLVESTCVSCGICVQVCPTGAFIDRQSAFRGQETDIERIKNICIGCDVGCGVELIVRDNQLLRIEGDWDAPVNEGRLCEIGRFLPLKEERERIVKPLVRKNGILETATWDEALKVVSDRFRPLAGKNGDGVAAYASPRLPIEALYLFKGLFADGLGSSMVTSADDQVIAALPEPVSQEFGRFCVSRLDALSEADCVVVVGADLVSDHQVVGFMVKRILPQGTKLVVIDSSDNPLNELANYALRPRPGTEVDLLRKVITSVIGQGLARSEPETSHALTEFTAKDASQITDISATVINTAAKLVGSSQRPFFIYGIDTDETNVTRIPEMLAELARLVAPSNSDQPALLCVQGSVNSVAAGELDLAEPFELNGQQGVFLALGDDRPSQRLIQKLEGAPFIAVQASYVSPVTDRADVVLPVEMWAEQEGHYLNLEGRIQATQRALTPPEEVISNACVLTAMANRIGVDLDTEWQTVMHKWISSDTSLQRIES